jgi:hypothetical protein
MSDISLFTLDRDGIVVFSMKGIDREVSGPAEALQLVAKCMLTEPGSDAFAPSDGGGVKDMMAKGMQGVESTRVDAAIIVRKTMETIRRTQRSDRPANATVVALELVDAVPVRNDTKIIMRVRIRLQDGSSFVSGFRGVYG